MTSGRREGILKRLKEETANSHSALENTFLLQHFRDKGISFPVYLTILAKFYCFFNNTESILNAYDRISFYLTDFKERRKSILIEEDIIFLTGNKPELPFCNVPELKNLSEAMGALYVLEGSTLGGKLISAVLKETLGIQPGQGSSFFYGYGPETGEKWKAFCSAITLFSQTEGNDDDILLGADKTFTHFKNWLES